MPLYNKRIDIKYVVNLEKPNMLTNKVRKKPVVKQLKKALNTLFELSKIKT